MIDRDTAVFIVLAGFLLGVLIGIAIITQTRDMHLVIAKSPQKIIRLDGDSNLYRLVPVDTLYKDLE